MKIFTLVLLTAAAVTAAPTNSSAAEDGKNTQHVILKEIINSVKHLNATLKDEAKKMFVHRAVTREHCTPHNLCVAAAVLEELKAENLGLEEKDWLLPRQLVAYTRSIQCKAPASNHNVELEALLENILHCSQKMFAKH